MVLFGFVLLVLAGAIVVLFAMFGELSTRVAEPVEERTVQPLPLARTGISPSVWPPALAPLADPSPEPSVVLVLSTACASCEEIAGQLAAELRRDGRPERLAVVVSTSDQARGEEFMARHGLGPVRHHIDPQGEWVRGELAVDASPSALVIRDGLVESVLWFSDLGDLRAALARGAVRTPSTATT